MASKVAARTNKRLYDVAPEEYEEAKLLVSKAYEVNPRSDEFKSKVSLGMRRYRAENAFTEEHLRRIRESTSRHKEENLKLGLTIYGTPIRKSGECDAAQQFASRSKGVYCILSSGERFYFKSIREASIWWFNNYKPFGDSYAECTLQRKIKRSCSGEDLVYNKSKHDIIKIDYIKWFYITSEGGDVNEKVNNNKNSI